jgi:ribonuclease BN (tRNA processing enzyme)
MELLYLKNCGVYIEIGGVKMMVDGINSAYRGYSSFTEKEYRDYFLKEESRFGGLDHLIFTHYHTDHYNKKKVTRYLKSNEDCKVIGPREKGNFYYRDAKLAAAGIEIIGIDFPHSGNELADILHNMIFIKSDEANILITSDANFQSEGLADKVWEAAGTKKIDVAFFNPLFIADKHGRKTIDTIKANMTYIYHMPEGDNDPMKVKAFAMATFEDNYGDDPHVILLKESMQKLDTKPEAVWRTVKD